MEMEQMLAGLRKGTAVSDRQPQQLLLTEASSAGWERVRQSLMHEELVRELREVGGRLLAEPIPQLPFSLYKLFDTTGERVQFQDAYFRRRQRLQVFTVMVLLDDSRPALEALEDTLWAICDEYSWCLPAHMGGLSISGGEAAEAHRCELDLFACETAFYLSEILHLLGDRLSPVVAARLRREVMKRVIEPYASFGPARWWETSDMNWGAVCAGSIGAALMYLIPEDEKLAPLLYRIHSTMQSFLSGFPADGACLEGIGYWNYGFGFFVYYAALLKQRTAGAIDMLQDEHVREIALFQQRSYLNEDVVISYSDAPQRYHFNLGLTHYLKRCFSELEVPDMRYRTGLQDNDGCYRFVPYIRSLVWGDPDLAGSAWQTSAYTMEESGLFVSRYVLAEQVTAFSVKGGHNDEPHNHNDLGSFILYADGVTYLVDPGAGVYTKAYFGEARYDFIHTGSHGHSVPRIDGVRQSTGRERAAQLLEAVSDEWQDRVRLDLTAAYEVGHLRTYVRQFAFEKEARVLSIVDQFEFETAPTSLIEQFVTFLVPVEAAPGVVRIARAGEAGVELHYDAEQWRCVLLEEPFVPEDGERATLHIIQLEARRTSLTADYPFSFVVKEAD